MKVINLTRKHSSGLDSLVAGESLEIIDLPKNLKIELNSVFKRVKKCVDSNIGIIDETVMISCTELSIIAGCYIAMGKDINSGVSIQDMIEAWNNNPDDENNPMSDKNIKSKNWGIIIDSPGFMMPHLQNDIGFLTHHLFVKYGNKIVPATFY